jgi:kynurenine formamidase
VIDLANGYRVIDLSEKVIPDLLELNGDYTWGTNVRKFELHQFMAKHDQMIMHFVNTETHIGTHVELPRHLKKDGMAAADMPLDAFFGEAIVLNFDFLKPKRGKGQPVLLPHLEKVKRGDIVLMWSNYKGDERPYIAAETARWLAKRPIKMLGVTVDMSVALEDPRSYDSSFADAWATHKTLLGNDIPIIENLVNLEAVEKERVFLIALPLRVSHMESSWTRAIALEPAG